MSNAIFRKQIYSLNFQARIYFFLVRKQYVVMGWRNCNKSYNLDLLAPVFKKTGNAVPILQTSVKPYEATNGFSLEAISRRKSFDKFSDIAESVPHKYYQLEGLFIACILAMKRWIIEAADKATYDKLIKQYTNVIRKLVPYDNKSYEVKQDL